MSIIKSFSVGNGDTFYIDHGSDNFTQIDCSLPDDRRTEMLDELASVRSGKGISRFIATHPEADHVGGLHHLDDHTGITNFYCVENQAQTDASNEGIKRYRKLHDNGKAFYITAGCTRRWMNQTTDERGSAGVSVLWPHRDNPDFTDALAEAESGGSANNICPVIRYKQTDGASVLWAGDLEADFMDRITTSINLSPTTIVFAPHHGRKSGRLPTSWLEALDPRIIVIGEANSEHLDYCGQHNTITQNTAGDIAFDLAGGKVHVHVSSPTYEVDFLDEAARSNLAGMHYIGTLTP